MKHIFWAHSPIGYEVFRSFRDHKLVDEKNSLLITARNFSPPDSDCNLGLPEEYIWMNEIQFNDAANKIIKLIKKLDGEDFILCVPQTANFFIRCLIESPHCLGFYIFDEGSAAREPLFQKRVDFRGFYKYEVKKTPKVLNFLEFLKIDIKAINKIYISGVSFYEAQHIKLLGFMSHFERAFPNKNATKILRSDVVGTRECSQHALLLMPPFHALLKKEDFNSRLQNLVNSVKAIRMLDKNLNLVIKFHPHDGDEIALKVSHLFDSIPFNKFCDQNNISKFREPAFMGFKVYIGYPNSTIDFIKEIGGNYIAF
jgi:hypothetical protein